MTRFSTGEFAEICGVKKQTLFHYDDIGLLKPSHTHANGYRYYSIQQLEVFMVIKMLKEINMPLAEIKQFLDIKSPDKTIALLTEKEALMTQKILDMQQLQRIIKNKRTQIEAALKFDTNALSIQPMASYRYLLSDKIEHNTEKSASKVFMSFIDYAKKKGVDSGYSVGIMLPQADLLADRYGHYTHFYLRVDDPLEETAYTTPPGNYVVAYHKGHYAHIQDTYVKIKRYLAQQAYQISGDGFEEYILDEMSVSETDHYVTKIMIRVTQ
ncbi:MAG: MerR family transcriptional regulator [Neisseriaceae bacterium]|nr:MerR family transcriptional regulator [Neisseriaceae bacterium]MBP6862229.1 MerR family transcriptional regulator [Neisseriaceae bacterium]